MPSQFCSVTEGMVILLVREVEHLTVRLTKTSRRHTFGPIADCWRSMNLPSVNSGQCCLTFNILIGTELVFMFLSFSEGAPCPFFKSQKCALSSFKSQNCAQPVLEVKNAPCLYSEMKNKPCPFSTISRARKLDSCRKLENAIWKVCVWKNSCT